jgi:hypothetical protein
VTTPLTADQIIGRDVIADFETGSDKFTIGGIFLNEGDTASPTFGLFDSDGDGVLTDADDLIQVVNGSTILTYGDSTITFQGVTGLTEANYFEF